MTGVTLYTGQQDIATEYHWVLLKFLENRGLAEDEYYDIVVFPYLDAVQKYEENPQGDFAKIAYEYMQSELDRHLSRQRRKNDKVKLLSLDYIVSQKGSLTFGDVFADTRADFTDEICRKLSRPKGYRLSHISQNAVRAVRLVSVGGGMCSGV